MRKKLLSLLLAVVMVIMVLPVTALAAPNMSATMTVTASPSPATVGDTVTFTITVKKNGTSGNLNGAECRLTAATEGVLLTGANGKVEKGDAIGVCGNISEVSWTVTAENVTGDCAISVSLGKTNGTGTKWDEICSAEGSVTVAECDHAGKMQNVSAQEATCDKEGRIEHTACSCGALFIGTRPAKEEELIIPAGKDSMVHHEAKTATCTEGGNVEYWECPTCGGFFSADNHAGTSRLSATEVFTNAGKTSLVHHEAKAATCTEGGNIEYWECPVCGKYFKEDRHAATSEVSATDVFTNAGEVALVHHEAKTATCTEGGNIEYWECPVCGKYFKEDRHAATSEVSATDVFTNAGEVALVHHDAKAATCTEGGNIEYWECAVCGKYFKEDRHAATSEVSATDVFTNAGEVALVHHDAKAATCTEGGNIEYWECAVCGKYFKEDRHAATSEVSATDVFTNAGEVALVHHDAKAATCTEGGNIEYWECAVCGKYFKEDRHAATSEVSATDVFTNAGEVALVHHEAKTATCTEGGNIEYWECAVCGKYFKEDRHAATSEVSATDVFTNAGEVALVYHEAKAATCTEGGNIEYWECAVCGKYFKEDRHAATSEVKATDIFTAAAGEKLVHHDAKPASCTIAGNVECWECTSCGKYFSSEKHEEASELSGTEVFINSGKDSMEHFDAVEATCTEGGNIEYWECPICEHFFRDASHAATSELAGTDVFVSASGHALTHNPESKENYENWHCSICEKYFADEACTEELSEEQIWKEHSDCEHNMVFYPQVVATCTEDGMFPHWLCVKCGSRYANLDGTGVIPEGKEIMPARGHRATEFTDGEHTYWLCAICGECFADAECTVPFDKGELDSGENHTHILAHYDAKAPNCQEEGRIEYWECLACGKCFRDAQGKTEVASNQTVLPADASKHELHLREETQTTIAHWWCVVCGKCYANAAGEGDSLTSDQLLKAETVGTHSLLHREALDGGCLHEGRIEYWECVGEGGDKCGRFFADPEAKQPLSEDELTTPVKGHSWEAYAAIEATKENNGRKAFDYCPVCRRVKTADHPTPFRPVDHPEWLVIPKLGDETDPGEGEGGDTSCKHVAMIFRSGKTPTCTADGWADYYLCGECGLYLNEAKEETTWDALHLNALGHDLIHMEATQTNVEYWHCQRCGKNFADAAGTIPLDDVRKPVEPRPENDPLAGMDHDLDLTTGDFGLSTILGKDKQP